MPGVAARVAAIALLVLPLAAGCGAKPAEGPGPIVYAVDSGQGSKHAGLFVVDVDGGNHRRLTRAPDPAAIAVHWSPTRDELLLEVQTRSSGEIWLMNEDGSSGRNVADGLGASWSRDGSRIAVVNAKGGISILSADGSPQTEIDLGLAENESVDMAPDWLADERELVLSVNSLNIDASRIVAVGADGNGRPRDLTEPRDGVLEERPTWSPDGSMIAFQSIDRETGPTAWVMRADGSARRLVARDAGPPVWSLDGKSLVCEITDPRDEHVAAYPLDGGAPRRLGPYRSGLQESRGRFRHRLGREVSWQRDGSRVAYVDDAGEVIVSRPDGSEKRQLTGPKEAMMPAWSPDGDTIAFVRGDDGDSEVYVVDADGENERRVVDGAGPQWSPDGTELLVDDVRRKEIGFKIVSLASLRPQFFDGDEPEWSPDGTRIGFVRHQRNEEDVPGPSTLYTMRRDGTGLRPIAKTRTGDTPAVFRGPEWTPDGTNIVVGEHDPIDGGPGRLVEVRADGSGETRTIVPDKGVTFDVTIAPDGERAVFVSGDGARVETIDLDSGARKTVASTEQGFIWSPRWSPDGEWLAYVVVPDEAVSNLFVMRADGSGRRRISQPPEPVSDFDWRPTS